MSSDIEYSSFWVLEEREMMFHWLKRNEFVITFAWYRIILPTHNNNKLKMCHLQKDKCPSAQWCYSHVVKIFTKLRFEFCINSLSFIFKITNLICSNCVNKETDLKNMYRYLLPFLTQIFIVKLPFMFKILKHNYSINVLNHSCKVISLFTTRYLYFINISHHGTLDS